MPSPALGEACVRGLRGIGQVAMDPPCESSLPNWIARWDRLAPPCGKWVQSRWNPRKRFDVGLCGHSMLDAWV